MSDILVCVIVALCGNPADVGITSCMEDINNCAVGRRGRISEEDIIKCTKAPDVLQRCKEDLNERPRKKHSTTD